MSSVQLIYTETCTYEVQVYFLLSRAGLSLIFWMFKISSLPSFLISSLVHLTKKALYKSEEEEADLLAIEALKTADLSQRGGETFFLKLLRYNPVRKGFLRRVVNIVLEDHPLPEKRLEKVKGLMCKTCTSEVQVYFNPFFTNT